MILGLLLLASGALASDNDAYVYPEYCAKLPLDKESRQSPPIQDLEKARTLELKSVQMVFRHGARAPVFYEPCWKGYKPEWICDYKQSVIGVDQTDVLDSTIEFRKHYDAAPSGNAFSGTCGLGFLLIEGARQLGQIGKWIAESYLIENNENKLPRPNSKPLFTSEETDEKLYLRTTDTQRTVASGMNLVSSMLRETFGDEAQNLIDLHTTDFSGDPFVNNFVYCPPLLKVLQRYFKSPELKTLRKSGQTVIDAYTAITGVKHTNSYWSQIAVDCIMPTICTERWNEFPESLNPMGPRSNEARELLKNLENFIDKDAWFTYQYNDGEVSKLVSSSVTKSIKDNIQKHLKGSRDTVAMNLISTHDTTLTSVLYSFLRKGTETLKFPPYASLFTIELYQDVPTTSFWFRMIYNGQVVTKYANGCGGKELCEIDNLLNQLDWVDEAVETCTSTKTREPISELYETIFFPKKNVEVSFSKTWHIPSVAVASGAGILIGYCIKTFFFPSKRSHLPTYERD